MFGYWKSGGCGKQPPPSKLLKGGYAPTRQYLQGSAQWGTSEIVPIVEMDENGVHTPPSAANGIYNTYYPVGSRYIICTVIYGSFSAESDPDIDKYFDGVELHDGLPDKWIAGSFALVFGSYCMVQTNQTPNRIRSVTSGNLWYPELVRSCVSGVSSYYKTPPAGASRSGNIVMKLNTRYGGMQQASKSARAEDSDQQALYGAYTTNQYALDNGYTTGLGINEGPGFWHGSVTPNQIMRISLEPGALEFTNPDEGTFNVSYPMFGDYDMVKFSDTLSMILESVGHVIINGKEYSTLVNFPDIIRNHSPYPGGPVEPGCNTFGEQNFGAWGKIHLIEP